MVGMDRSDVMSGYIMDQTTVKLTTYGICKKRINVNSVAYIMAWNVDSN